MWIRSSPVSGAKCKAAEHPGKPVIEPRPPSMCAAELNAVAEALLRRLHDWQERTRATNPHNARRKRRLVSGLREVDKAVRGRKAQALLLAPNVGPIAPTFETPESGSDDNKGVAQESPITALLALAAEREVPVVFCLSRQRMGRVRVGLQGRTCDVASR